MLFPSYRPRRMRQTNALRKIIRETSLSINDFVLPLFVVRGKNIKNEIESMPGHYHMSIDNLMIEAKRAFNLGIQAIILFGIPSRKDAFGTSAYDHDGVVQNAVKELKENIPGLMVITDVCLCQYTDHGHCGIINEKQLIDNDATLELIAKIAISHAEAGSDMVAPSDMMDGRVAKIRSALDKVGFSHVPIMSYAVKYCSNFYGPFRQAANSTPNFGDRQSYQMDPSNSREAIREALMDTSEGADIIMIKPALSYLDIISNVRQIVDLPVAAYNVSGEYSMIKAAGKLGWVNAENVMIEVLTSIKRAGADKVKKLVPGINEEDLMGGTFSPNDGSASPLLSTNAFTQRAILNGAKFKFQEKVNKLLLDKNNKITGVKTNKNKYETAIVIDAAGANSPQLCQTVGVNIQVIPDSHEAAITEPVQRIFKCMVVDLRPGSGSKNFYLYQNIHGQIIFCITPDPPIIGTSNNETSLFLPQVCSRILNLIPSMYNVRVRRMWRGSYPMTPDGSPIVGWNKDVPGLFHLTGMCGQGFMLGPGMGELATRIITDNCTKYDITTQTFFSPYRKFYGKYETLK